MNFCWKPGFVSLFVDLPKTGFIPGEEIPISIKVENNAGVFFKSVKIHFHQCIKYTSYLPRVQVKTSTISQVHNNLTMSGAASRTVEATLITPQAPPSSETLSKVIRISYEISIIIETTKKMIIRSSVPIIIGYDPVEIEDPVSEDTVDIQSIAGSSMSK